MRKWSDEFFEILNSSGVKIEILNTVNGWIETVLIRNKKCYVKSVSYNLNRVQYFQGTDPKKLNESGDFVIICGGYDNMLRDIFILPWKLFFNAIKNGEPINTYKLPKIYYQIKFYITDSSGKWLLYIQPTTKNSPIDVNQYCFKVSSAISYLITNT